MRLFHQTTRVAHVTLGLGVGGQEKLLLEFARHADQERFDLRFVSLGGRDTFSAALERCGCRVAHLDGPDGLSGSLVLRLARLLRRWQVDVVHTHEDRPLIHAVPAARLAGVRRIIHTRHGQSATLTRRQRALINLATRWVHRFVCVSHDSARLALAHGVHPRRVATIWNGIDLERYPYAGPCPAGPAVCVARLSPEKGVDTLVRATAVIVRREPAFRLEIAGEGICEADLRRLSAELGVQDHIAFLGHVDDVSGLLARASVFVLPSLSEGVALTILEAMARGLPVVATRVGGTVEAVAEGETGLLAPPSDPEALAAALLQVRADPARARALGRKGRERAEQHFDARQMVRAYEFLYGPQTRGRQFSISRPAYPRQPSCSSALQAAAFCHHVIGRCR